MVSTGLRIRAGARAPGRADTGAALCAVAFAQPDFVAPVADGAHHGPVENTPEITKRRMLPGPDIGTQPGDPPPFRGLQERLKRLSRSRTPEASVLESCLSQTLEERSKCLSRRSLGPPGSETRAKRLSRSRGKNTAASRLPPQAIKHWQPVMPIRADAKQWASCKGTSRYPLAQSLV